MLIICTVCVCGAGSVHLNICAQERWEIMLQVLVKWYLPHLTYQRRKTPSKHSIIQSLQPMCDWELQHRESTYFYLINATKDSKFLKCWNKRPVSKRIAHHNDKSCISYTGGHVKETKGHHHLCGTIFQPLHFVWSGQLSLPICAHIAHAYEQ